MIDKALPGSFEIFQDLSRCMPVSLLRYHFAFVRILYTHDICKDQHMTFWWVAGL